MPPINNDDPRALARALNADNLRLLELLALHRAARVFPEESFHGSTA